MRQLHRGRGDPGRSGLERRPALRGFTLIELVVTMVIIAILAAIAIPSYTSYVRKGRRTDAKSALLDRVRRFRLHRLAVARGQQLLSGHSARGERGDHHSAGRLCPGGRPDRRPSQRHPVCEIHAELRGYPGFDKFRRRGQQRTRNLLVEGTAGGRRAVGAPRPWLKAALARPIARCSRALRCRPSSRGDSRRRVKGPSGCSPIADIRACRSTAAPRSGRFSGT